MAPTRSGLRDRLPTRATHRERVGGCVWRCSKPELPLPMCDGPDWTHMPRWNRCPAPEHGSRRRTSHRNSGARQERKSGGATAAIPRSGPPHMPSQTSRVAALSGCWFVGGLATHMRRSAAQDEYEQSGCRKSRSDMVTKTPRYRVLYYMKIEPKFRARGSAWRSRGRIGYNENSGC